MCWFGSESLRLERWKKVELTVQVIVRNFLFTNAVNYSIHPNWVCVLQEPAVRVAAGEVARTNQFNIEVIGTFLLHCAGDHERDTSCDAVSSPLPHLLHVTRLHMCVCLWWMWPSFFVLR